MGMVLISGMTLWLTIKDKILRVSAKFDIGLLPGPDGIAMNRPVYCLSFTNIGSRPVTVTNFRWVIRRPWLKKTFSFTFPHLDPDIGILNTIFPCELTDGKEGHIFHHKTFFADLEEPEKMLFNDNPMIAWWQIQTFQMQICTTVGKEFKVQIPYRVRKDILKQFKLSRTQHF